MTRFILRRILWLVPVLLFVSLLREREYVHAAQSLGATPSRILTQHLLPNAAGPVVVRLTYAIPAVIFAEAVLSFIGLGVRPPQASWGTMVQQGNQAIFSAPHLVLFPAWPSPRRC